MAPLPLVSKSARLALTLLLALGVTALAQNSPAPQPSAKSVHFNFLPPPLEGSISLGIYDSVGKLVRVLHREAELEDFEIGNDALGATWDGLNDQGEISPPGKYHARGYVVGELEVEGVGFFFNDWVTDGESPRIQRINNLKLMSENELAMLVTLPGEADASANYDFSTKELAISEGHEDERFLPDRGSVRAVSGKLSFHRADGWEDVTWPDLIAPLDAAEGKNGSVWVIDRAEPGSKALALKQFSQEGAFLRQMSFAPDDPQPRLISAAPSAERIFILEENASVQRVRGLSLSSTTVAANPSEKSLSDWKVEFEKKIVKHKDFSISNGQPVVAAEKPPLDKVAVKLQPNPLQKDEKGTLELSVGYDTDSSFLKTADGLPLRTVSETPSLVRVLLGAFSGASVDVFQDDGAVLEQFRVSNLDQMMAFDCGEIELK